MRIFLCAFIGPDLNSVIDLNLEIVINTKDSFVLHRVCRLGAMPTAVAAATFAAAAAAAMISGCYGVSVGLPRSENLPKKT
eukprot:SAG11_NODE_9998_length_863_cov_2.340314_1_plen_81_part_00